MGTMYESNDRSLKSVYSYDQYHWCPMALRVRSGSSISSIMYRICSDGRASRMRTMAGRMVQISSTSCASTVFDDSFSINMRVRR